jgi:hypothetical protein
MSKAHFAKALAGALQTWRVARRGPDNQHSKFRDQTAQVPGFIRANSCPSWFKNPLSEQ